MLYSEAGTIRYPQPSSQKTPTYPSNLNCAWTIETNVSLVLNLTFAWIDVEKSVQCGFDYVEVKIHNKCY